MFSLAWTVLFWKAEGALATTSLEFEYLHRKSRCKMLIAEMTLVMTSLPLARAFTYFKYV